VFTKEDDIVTGSTSTEETERTISSEEFQKNMEKINLEKLLKDQVWIKKDMFLF